MTFLNLDSIGRRSLTQVIYDSMILQSTAMVSDHTAAAAVLGQEDDQMTEE
jgi:hypothetical protein